MFEKLCLSIKDRARSLRFFNLLRKVHRNLREVYEELGSVIDEERQKRGLTSWRTLNKCRAKRRSARDEENGLGDRNSAEQPPHSLKPSSAQPRPAPVPQGTNSKNARYQEYHAQMLLKQRF